MFRTGQIVPESGVYCVRHDGHRLPHEVTLLRDEVFPRCAKCDTHVVFEALHLAPQLSRQFGAIVVYELPEVDEDSGLEPSPA